MDLIAIRKKVRPIVLPMAFSAIGFLFVFVLKKVFNINISKLELSIIAFIVTSISVLWLFPKVFKIPFGKVTTIDFIRNVGLNIPNRIYLFVFLGFIAAFFTLSGMYLGSTLTGKYIFDPSKITIAQAVFSLTPGVWEEILYRGVIMIVILRLTKSFKKAFIIQIILFGFAHIKGFDFLSFVDAFSVLVIAISFTYIAFKTKSLIPGIIFHYLHDTFLFVVQLPDGNYSGLKDNALFYSALWISVGLSVLVVKRLSERLNIVNDYDFYLINSGVDNKSSIPVYQDKSEKREKGNKKILIINAIGFAVLLLASLDESNLFILILISLFVLANISLYLLWDKVKRNIDFQINLITAIISFATAYDFYSKGSKYVYIAWILIGFIYLFVAIARKYWKKKDILNK
jgi:membrane protease YdiL (CAAX protease family)